ncbi:MAG: class B sortase [Clostridiales bacterium]|nr:class B sortase [Clostridiales bacterium]
MDNILRNLPRNLLIGGLIAVMAVSGLAAVQMQNGYKAEGLVSSEMAAYKPPAPIVGDASAGAADLAARTTPAHINHTIVGLQERYPDAVGWINIPHTGIDYPFVQTYDNSYYLHKDIDENYLAAGTLFMDCGNNGDFSDFNTIIYGHHMKNGSMFGPLALYEDRAFFDTNATGHIFLSDKTFELEFFAYMIVHFEDLAIYDSPTDRASKLGVINYIKDTARHYREDIDVSPNDQIVTLSTCAYEFKDARMLLIGRLRRV